MTEADRFRVGRSVGRTIYMRLYGTEHLIGVLDTAALARFAVDSMNLNLDNVPLPWKEYPIDGDDGN